jgi:hypothetical protein
VADAEITQNQGSDPSSQNPRDDSHQERWDHEKDFRRSIGPHREKPCLTEREESRVTQEEVESESKNREQENMNGDVKDVSSHEVGKKKEK